MPGKRPAIYQNVIMRCFMQTARKPGAASTTVLILLARDFVEGSIVQCLERFRKAGISVSLVGLSDRLVKGYHGMVVRPDVSVGQLPRDPSHKLLVIPEGEACVSALFADPRVHRLVRKTVRNEGVVAAMPEAERMLEKTGLVTPESSAGFVWRGDRTAEEMGAELVEYVQWGEFGHSRKH